MTTSIAVELIAIDEPNVKTKARPATVSIGYIEMDAAIFKFLRTQSADMKSKVVDTALALEQRTAAASQGR